MHVCLNNEEDEQGFVNNNNNKPRMDLSLREKSQRKETIKSEK